jgi:periplasmic divalent cation tolerance protein
VITGRARLRPFREAFLIPPVRLVVTDFSLSGSGGNMKLNFVYMTAGSKDEARKIGKELVISRLAACVNILDNMNSVYMWEGKVQDDAEVVMIAKTSEDCIPRLIEKVKSLHSYDCPCIVSLPVVNGHQPFLDWIAEEVK